MTPALHDALEAVYEEFRAPTPARIEGCPCCVERKTVKALHSRALRELTADDLGAYAASVFLTVGEVRDFRYFLPRFLELGVTEPGFSIGLEVVIGKLALAGWTAWPAREQRVVKAVFDAWFDEEAGKDEDDSLMDDLLCGMGRAGLDPVAYIDGLVRDGRDYALCILWERNAYTIRKREGLSSAFWDDIPDVEAAVVRRLLAPDIQAIVT